MTVHNIRIKKRDGSEWITLHPETMAKNVIVENGKTVQYELDNHTHRYAGSSSVGGAANSERKLVLLLHHQFQLMLNLLIQTHGELFKII